MLTVHLMQVGVLLFSANHFPSLQEVSLASALVVSDLSQVFIVHSS